MHVGGLTISSLSRKATASQSWSFMDVSYRSLPENKTTGISEKILIANRVIEPNLERL